ncbi:MAG: GNAT family N-acetyltransferase [Ignavibacteriales bacterium]|nr:MAG: GNAT family N-acetyltransferase [Ignavibacteriales bacterium]
MSSTTIRKVSPGELEELQKISRETFIQTFAAVNSEENMKQYLEENLSQKRLASELKNPNSEFYFALDTGKITGYLKINLGPAQTEQHDPGAVEIERIYALSEYYGKETGRMLLDKALQRAKELHAPSVWLGVWEKNYRALSFYRKNGFTEFGTHPFRLGNDEQTDLLMRKNLT